MPLSLPPRTRFILGFCLALAVIAGCGVAVPVTGQVSGTVTLDGAPVTDCVVTFEDSSGGHGGSARVEGGNFQFAMPLNAGEYQVAVQPPPPPAPTAPVPATPPAKIPPKYLQVASSGLTALVEEGPNKFEFKLTQ